MDSAEAETRLAEIRADGGKSTTEELDQIWAALATVRPEEILGSWAGGEFVTGHPFEGRLAEIGWHGKTFTSLTDVTPLVCRDADGILYSNTAWSKGGASLWMVEFRGESTATMVYDGRPVFDHFKRGGDDTLLGVMNGKGVLADDGRTYYFVLDRDNG